VSALFGFLLGVVLTVAAAYTYDAQTGRKANGLSAVGGVAPLVNWDVVSDDWHNVQANVRDEFKKF
jgi:hypothetical protein